MAGRNDGQAGGVQGTDAVLMVRPAGFGFNPDAAPTNRLQQRPQAEAQQVQASARAEFAALHAGLLAEGLRVCVVDDTVVPAKPDAVFPNNWVSFHADGTVVLYPLQPPSRRAERREAIIEQVCGELGYPLRRRLDLSRYEREGRFLEGTGSLVLDPRQRRAYACLSPRTDQSLLHEWCSLLDYEPVAFRATDAHGVPWYHTNVMLCIGTAFALVAAESIDPQDRERVLDSLAASGRELIEIDRAAVGGFAGNLLELSAWDEALGDMRVLVMSARARRAVEGPVWQRLSACVDSVLTVPVPTIEQVGGGGVRCMLAEVGIG
ncbi:MAG: amidinotransferase [Sinobacteraceae bacterium]|nr:amidinotransferase [Nevskiaceae bacterium]